MLPRLMQGRLPHLHATSSEITELCRLIHDRRYPVSDIDAASFRTISKDFEAMQTVVTEVKDARASMTKKFGEELKEGKQSIFSI